MTSEIRLRGEADRDVPGSAKVALTNWLRQAKKASNSTHVTPVTLFQDFEASKKFLGERPGFVFKRGRRGYETEMFRYHLVSNEASH